MQISITANVFINKKILDQSCIVIYKLLMKVATWYCTRSLPIYTRNLLMACLCILRVREHGKTVLMNLKLKLVHLETEMGMMYD